jgi:hypothetical protein
MIAMMVETRARILRSFSPVERRGAFAFPFTSLSSADADPPPLVSLAVDFRCRTPTLQDRDSDVRLGI